MEFAIQEPTCNADIQHETCLLLNLPSHHILHASSSLRGHGAKTHPHASLKESQSLGPTFGNQAYLSMQSHAPAKEQQVHVTTSINYTPNPHQRTPRVAKLKVIEAMWGRTEVATKLSVAAFVVFPDLSQSNGVPSSSAYSIRLKAPADMKHGVVYWQPPYLHSYVIPPYEMFALANPELYTAI